MEVKSQSVSSFKPLLIWIDFFQYVAEAEKDKQKLITKLQSALEEVKTLEGILPICSSCKKIRDDRGQWNSVEYHIQNHSEAQFTLGCCPDCFKELYPEVPYPSSENS